MRNFFHIHYSRLVFPVLLSLFAMGCSPFVAAAQPDPATTDQRSADDEARRARYGKTPDTAIPYRNFKDPYTRFFQERLPFRGTGRYPASTTGLEASADVPKSVRIGFFGPLGSAPDGDLGQDMLDGVTLAIEQANAAGGYVVETSRLQNVETSKRRNVEMSRQSDLDVSPRDERAGTIPFELVQRSDAGQWGASSNEMVAFRYKDDVLAVIGSIDGANTHIALRVALKIEMPMVNTATTDPTLTETNIPWIVRCMADDRQQGYALAHHIFQECGIERVVAFRVNDRFGRTGIAEFRDAARRLRHPLRVELRWNRGERDFTVQLDRIAQTDAEAIVLWGNASDTAAVVREIRRRHMPLRIFGCDRLVSRTFLAEAGEAAGPTAAGGDPVVAVATYDPTGASDPASLRHQSFADAFLARFHHEPGTFAAHAYDGANILIAAIRGAGLNRVRIRDALYELTRYDGVTGSVEFDTTLNDVGPVYIATVEGGRFVYREVDFMSVRADRDATVRERVPARGSRAASDRPARPYRTLAQSPPLARPAESHGQTQRSLEASSYRVGCFVPLDDAGQAVVRGAQLALADDAARYPFDAPIELLVRDARNSDPTARSVAWSDTGASLVDLVLSEEVVALIGSTERSGTHLAEMLAAKFHFPVLTLCGNDPTITQIPLPWVFRIAHPEADPSPQFVRRYLEAYSVSADRYAALGYDAAALVASRIRAGAGTRRQVRNSLAGDRWYRGVSGTFRFDALGNRLEYPTPGVIETTAMGR